MVKVHCPRGGFARCVNTAVVGVVLSDTDWLDEDDYDAYSNYERDPRGRSERRGRDDADPIAVFFASQTHAIARALRKLERERQRDMELAQMEIFYRNMQLQQATVRNETMLLYDQAIASGGVGLASRRGV